MSFDNVKIDKNKFRNMIIERIGSVVDVTKICDCYAINLTNEADWWTIDKDKHEIILNEKFGERSGIRLQHGIDGYEESLDIIKNYYTERHSLGVSYIFFHIGVETLGGKFRINLLFLPNTYYDNLVNSSNKYIYK